MVGVRARRNEQAVVHRRYLGSPRKVVTPLVTPRNAKRGHHASTRPRPRRGISARAPCDEGLGKSRR